MHAEGPSDVDLLAAWRSGDASAGQALMARHYPSVLRFFELSATWVAEDLTQKTFLALLERSDALAPDRSIRGYVFGIARNQLAMHLRELAHRGNDPLGDREPAAETTRLSALVARAEEHRVLLRALVSLPSDLQLVLVLHYWEAMPSAEIADAVGIPASTVRGRLSRARELLRGEIRAVAGRSPLHTASDDELAQWLRSLVPTT
jgi:RNA polymerase sigma-70 factor (ECF subfamily)